MLREPLSHLETLYPTLPDRQRARSQFYALILLGAGALYAVLHSLIIPTEPRQRLAVLICGLVTLLILGITARMLYAQRIAAAGRLQAAGIWVIATLLIVGFLGYSASSAIMMLGHIMLVSFSQEQRVSKLILFGYVLTTAAAGAWMLLGGTASGLSSPGMIFAHFLGLTAALVGLGFVAQHLASTSIDVATHGEQLAGAEEDDLNVLVQIGTLAATAVPRDEMLKTVIARILDTFKFNRVNIFLLDELGDAVVQRINATTAEDLDLPVDAGSLIAQVIRRRETVLQRGQQDPAARAAPTTWVRCAMPLFSGDRVIGVLEMDAPHEDFFPSKVLLMLQALTSPIALALRNTPRYLPRTAPLDSGGPFHLATRQIGAARNPREVLDTLREFVMPDIDRISIVRTTRLRGGGTAILDSYEWDRDGIAINIDFPVEVIEYAARKDIQIIADLKELEDDAQTVRGFMERTIKASSAVLLPLSTQGELLGVLLMASRRPRHFTEREAQALQSLAGQVTTVLSNVALLTQLKEQTERLSLMNELFQQTSSIMDIQSLGRVTSDHLTRAVPLVHISAALFEPDDSEAEFLSFLGHTGVDRLVVEGTPLAYVVEHKESFHVDRGDTGIDEAPWLLDGVGSLLIIPLAVGERRFGTLNLGIGPAVSLSPGEIQLCEQVAAQMAVVVDNLRLFSQLEKSLEESTTLYGTSLAINAAQSLPEVYETVLQEVAQLSSADRIELYLGGPDPREQIEFIELVSSWENGRLTGRSRPVRFVLDEVPILAQFPQSRANLVFNNLLSDQRLADEVRDSLILSGITSMFMVPLSTGITWLGAVLVMGKQGQSFSSDTVRLCRSVADQAALAVDSQMLLARFERLARHEQTLRRVVERVRATQNGEDILAIAEEELANALNRTPEEIRTIDWNDRLALSPDEWELVTSVGNQVDLAIINLSLMESTQMVARREQIINELTAQLQRTATVEDVMARTVDTLRGVLSGYDVAVRLSPGPTEPPSATALGDGGAEGVDDAASV